MALTRSIHNLALIGFMGAGKSVVGRTVADLLHFEFLDTDQEIAERAGRSIAEIFAREGEATFRAWESQVVGELAVRRKTVISTGGGLPAQPGNLASLKTHALVVCLWASPEILYERVREHTHRPLLHQPDPLATIRTLFAAREPFYREADVLVNTEQRSVREVAAQVVHQFHAAQHGSHESAR